MHILADKARLTPGICKLAHISSHLVCRRLCEENHWLGGSESSCPLQDLRQVGDGHASILQGRVLHVAVDRKMLTCRSPSQTMVLPRCTLSAFLPTCRPFWSIQDPLIDANHVAGAYCRVGSANIDPSTDKCSTTITPHQCLAC